MPKFKFFVFSDIHGFYKQFIDALNEAGYDATNPDHYLIGCGDYFNRGKEPRKVYNFLMEAPNCYLVRGNHEDLMMKMLKRGYPMMHDYQNGTYQTIYDFIGKSIKDPVTGELLIGEEKDTAIFNKFYYYFQKIYNKTIDFFETRKYIFVHGWIPKWYCSDWRFAPYKYWEDARWLNGFNECQDGNYEKDKIIVCGHWHCSYAHSVMKGTSEFGKDAIFTPYVDDKIMCIDACTAHSKTVNVVVIEDDFF